MRTLKSDDKENDFYKMLEKMDSDILTEEEIEDKPLQLPYANPPKLSNEKWK